MDTQGIKSEYKRTVLLLFKLWNRGSAVWIVSLTPHVIIWEAAWYPSSLLYFCVCLASEWSPAGFACFPCLVASRSLSLVYYPALCEGVSPRLLISKALAALVPGSWEQCMVWLRLQRKDWAAEICPFLPVSDSLSACKALAAICCCINRQ